MVFTVEPGLYVPEGDESAPSELRGLGVRIEDDVEIGACTTVDRAMIGATVAIPLALAGAMGMFEANPAAVGQLIGTFFVVSGIATLAQTTIGNRYPIVQGGTFSMLAPAIAIITVLADGGAGWQTMILELQGAVIVAGVVALVVADRWLSELRD